MTSDYLHTPRAANVRTDVSGDRTWLTGKGNRPPPRSSPRAGTWPPAVKHFRWKPAPNGGKRRIHAKPDLRHVTACRPWLDAEFVLLSPRVVVTLGVTAGQALFGSSFRIGKDLQVAAVLLAGDG